MFVGSCPEHLNASMAATYISQMPAGASTKTFVHFAQVTNKLGRFTNKHHVDISKKDPKNISCQFVLVTQKKFANMGPKDVKVHERK